MPEPGGLQRRSRSHDSSASTRITGSSLGRRDYSSSDRQSPSEQKRIGSTQASGMRDASPVSSNTSLRSTAKRQRITLWQILFGQGNKRSSRRSALQQAGRKDSHANAGGLVPPPNLLQRLKPQAKPVSREQAASKLAETQVRQAVDGRSRQVSSWSPTSNTKAEQPKGKQLARQAGWRRGTTQPTTLQGFGAQALTALQSSPSDRQAQAQALALKREARERSRRGDSAQRHATPDISERAQGAERLKVRASTQVRKRDTPAQPRSRSFSAGLYAARMLILSVGIGVLVGTMLSVLDPAARSSAGASQQTAKKPGAAENVTQPTTALSSLSGESASAVALPKMGQELTSLKAALQTLALQNPRLTPGIFLYDLDTSSYLDLNGGASFAAASTIKVPILVAFFQDVDAGKIRLDELLTMRKELVAGGSGEMQGLPIGTQFTALETVIKMITISDNTATNMMIARLGGMAALDQRFRSWGLVSTAINNLLPDLNGTNTTSPKDMALLMTRISQGELVSMRSRDRLLDIMQRTVNRSQLPQGLGKGATIAHKTGDIGGLIGDVGLIDMPNGKRYALTVLVKRSYNDDQAYDLVQKASRTVYQYLDRTPAAPSSQALIPAMPNSSISVSSGDVSSLGAYSTPLETASTQPSSADTAAR